MSRISGSCWEWRSNVKLRYEQMRGITWLFVTLSLSLPISLSLCLSLSLSLIFPSASVLCVGSLVSRLSNGTYVWWQFSQLLALAWCKCSWVAYQPLISCTLAMPTRLVASWLSRMRTMRLVLGVHGNVFFFVALSFTPLFPFCVFCRRLALLGRRCSLIHQTMWL